MKGKPWCQKCQRPVEAVRWHQSHWEAVRCLHYWAYCHGDVEEKRLDRSWWPYFVKETYDYPEAFCERDRLSDR